MDERQLVCCPRSDTYSHSNSLCCFLITFSLLNILSSPLKLEHNLTCCSTILISIPIISKLNSDAGLFEQSSVDVYLFDFYCIKFPVAAASVHGTRGVQSNRFSTAANSTSPLWAQYAWRYEPDGDAPDESIWRYSTDGTSTDAFRSSNAKPDGANEPNGSDGPDEPCCVAGTLHGGADEPPYTHATDVANESNFANESLAGEPNEHDEYGKQPL